MNDFHNKTVKFDLYRSALKFSKVSNHLIKYSIVELAVGKSGDLHKIHGVGF